MAKENANGMSGMVGRVIYYKFRGKNVMRTAPDEVRQSKATERSATTFGVASSMSAVLRERMEKFLPFKLHRSVQWRLNSALFRWLSIDPRDQKGLSTGLVPVQGFQFHEKTPLLLRMNIGVEWNKKGNAVVHIPAFSPARDLNIPAGISNVVCQVAVAGCTSIGEWTTSAMSMEKFEISMKQAKVAAKDIELPFTLKKGDLGIVSMSLQYKVADADPWKGITGMVIDAAYLG